MFVLIKMADENLEQKTTDPVMFGFIFKREGNFFYTYNSYGYLGGAKMSLAENPDIELLGEVYISKVNHKSEAGFMLDLSEIADKLQKGLEVDVEAELKEINSKYN